MTSISYPKRELQATLIQLEADLRRLTSTVQALNSYLAQADNMAGPTGVPSPEAAPRAYPAGRTGSGGNIGSTGSMGSMGVAEQTRSAMWGGPTAPGLRGVWSLREGGWALMSPSGQRLVLTTLERKFMLAVFAAPNRSLARNELSALTSGRLEAEERPGTSPRGVDVMVSRLRRKAQALGMPLPLRSVRRWGYMFTEEAVTE